VLIELKHLKILHVFLYLCMDRVQLLYVRVSKHIYVDGLCPGNSAVQAIELLIQKGVPESHIIFLNLISVSVVGCPKTCDWSSAKVFHFALF
jgi:hypothetical protein